MQPIIYGNDTQVHPTTNTFLYSLLLSWELSGAIMQEKSRASEKYNTLSSGQAKAIALEHLTVQKKKANHASRKARESYERHFSRKVRPRSVLRTGDRV